MVKRRNKLPRTLMLKYRVLTALLLIPCVLLIIMLGNQWVLMSTIFVLIFGCAYEWLQLIPINKWILQTGFLCLVIGGCYLIQFCFLYWLFISLALWGFIVIVIHQ